MSAFPMTKRAHLGFELTVNKKKKKKRKETNKEKKQVKIDSLEWSPNFKHILFIFQC